MKSEIFAMESWTAIQLEGIELIQKHYEEIAHYHDIPLEPDHDLYLALEKSGILKVFTARDSKSNELIGYAVFFVRKNMHYKGSLQAAQDIIYIDQKRRGFGEKFILWCDKQLKDIDVQVVYHHVKTKFNFGPMLERHGYELIDLIYGRRLDQKDL